MIFTAEEYSDLQGSPPEGAGGRTNESGDANHIKDHNAIARLLWGPGMNPNSKITVIKITKNADSFNFSSPNSVETDMPFDSEYLGETMDSYMMYADFYDMIVSQEGLMDLPYAEWPVGAWCEVFADGLYALSMKTEAFFHVDQYDPDKKMIQDLSVSNIWTILKYTADIKKHVYTSGQWTPAFPEESSDRVLFDGNNFISSIGWADEEGKVIYSIRPKHLDTIKDLTARIEALESKNPE